MRPAALLLALLLTLMTSLAMAQARPAEGRPVVRIVTASFVLPAKFRAMEPLAQAEGVTLEVVYVEKASPAEWLANADLVILDAPRPNDRAQVEAALGDGLAAAGLPSITIGGGPPAWRGIDPRHAGALLGYYAAGGAENFGNFFAAIRLWREGGDLAALPPPVAQAQAGFWHFAAPHMFESFDAYLAWGAGRWKEGAGRIGFIVSAGAIGNMQTALAQALAERAEKAGLTPVIFWFDERADDGLTRIAGAAQLDALVNLTHLQNGAARAAEFLALDIPVIQTLGFRDGGAKEWAAASSGVPAGTAAVFIAGPEGWGIVDPLVLSAVEDGAEVPLPAQVEALIGKLGRLVALRRKPAGEKNLALLFWNYPAGEKNLAASNLNVPASVEAITQALNEAGYEIPPLAEPEMIVAGQAMLGGLHRTVALEDLLQRDLAAAFPVADYRNWLASLPPAKRHIFSHLAAPEKHWAVREIDGAPSFVIPRLKLGRLTIMPQTPRGADAGAHYHDTAAPPDHLYMAAYLYLRRQEAADAIIHLGAHGTQEWLPGKDRGLSADDDPFLAVGDVPVFYPYIQDNVGEALQAKRRGRAVTISHQTPPFAPSGLYDELRDIHHLVHEYAQLDEGAVRERTAGEIVDAAVAANMHADLAWSEEAARNDFASFLGMLHDHLHELARTAMPLGLHIFGRAADPDHRLGTIMQQLGQPFYAAAGADADELFAGEFSALKEAAPYAMLQKYLRDGEDRAGLEKSLQDMLDRADTLDARLSAPGEIEALLAGLAGRFIAPGAGGDPIRNPEVESGRNLFAFEPDRIPTKAAFEAGGEAFDQLVATFRADHDGAFPQKLAFSLWSSEAIRHLGVTEAQVLHALGVKPVWDQGGRVRALEIVPAAQLGRPRVDVVVQVTSVYRDQFDGFMRLLADAIARIAALDEAGNPVAANSARIAAALQEKGLPPAQARAQADLRIFSNAPGEYGTGLPHQALASTAWDDDSALAETFLASTQFAYGAQIWGEASPAGNLFAEQLKGAQAAIMSRSSNLNGVLSTDHPFEFLGGLSLAVRHLDGSAPSLYISDLREADAGKTVPLARFLSDELRVRTLNPHWIGGMQAQGYAGTLEMLNAANNLFGWQVVDPSSVREDQWQAMFDTYVADARDLGMNDYFETHNPTAQAQLMERMVEAIRKGYWDAGEETRRKLAERWRELAADHGVDVGEAPTKEFVARMAAGFGLAAAAAETPDAAAALANAPQPVVGQVLEEVAPADLAQDEWRLWLAMSAMLCLVALGGLLQWRGNARRE